MLVFSETEGFILSLVCFERIFVGRRIVKEFSVVFWRRSRLDFIVGRVFLVILLFFRFSFKSFFELSS